MSWLLTYSLFLVIICFVQSINTHQSPVPLNYKQSCFTSLAFSVGMLILAICCLCCCAILHKHTAMFQYSQMIGIAYLLYTGVSIMTQNKNKPKPVSNNAQNENFSNIIVNTTFNIKIAMVIMAIMTQFYNNISHWSILTLLLADTLVIGFLIRFCASFTAKYFQKYIKDINFIYKLLGFAIIILSVSNIKNVAS